MDLSFDKTKKKNHPRLINVIPLCDKVMQDEVPISGEHCWSSDATVLRRIKFASHVSVIDIPSRQSYSSEERETLWMPPHVLKQQTEKNLLEFAAEGWFWPNVVEEAEMVMVDGNFIHPIHINPMLKDALRRQIPYPRAVTPPDEDEHFLMDAQMEALDIEEEPVERPSSPFVETVFDQEYFSEEDDIMLLSQDPDAYLTRRFAHHHQQRLPRNDLPFGDSDDAYFTQMLYTTGQGRIG